MNARMPHVGVTLVSHNSTDENEALGLTCAGVARRNAIYRCRETCRI
jgi:hypothetical protein